MLQPEGHKGNYTKETENERQLYIPENKTFDSWKKDGT